MIPGIRPETSSLPTDTCMMQAYTTRPTPGGMMGVMQAEAAVTAAEYSSE